LALFDLDHTLIPIDSDHAWGDFTIARGWVDPVAFKQQNDQFYAQYQDGTLDIGAYVHFSTAAICRQGATNSIAAHADFMRDVVQKAIKPQALDLVRQHQLAGDTVVIVTATNEFVTRPIADAFGVTELIAVELERDTAHDGSLWFTGAVRGVPSFREGKVARVEQWLTAWFVLGYSAYRVLFRFHERPAAAGKGHGAGCHQSRCAFAQFGPGAWMAHT
jgi:HAD superfamily phosphoserine phosphatase-like hydrolase